MVQHSTTEHITAQHSTMLEVCQTDSPVEPTEESRHGQSRAGPGRVQQIDHVEAQLSSAEHNTWATSFSTHTRGSNVQMWWRHYR